MSWLKSGDEEKKLGLKVEENIYRY